MPSDSITVWKGRIQRAEAYQQKQHKMWEDAVKIYNCEFLESVLGSDPERVEVNFGNWYINNLVPLVYFRDPFIFIKPRNDKFASFADTMETIVNYYWRELKLKQEFKRVIMSGMMMPPGWIKLGYTAKIGQDVAIIDEVKEENAINVLKEAIKGIFTKKEENGKLPEQQGELNLYIKEENIFATWIPSWNMLMPEGYHVISKMPYLIEIEDVAMLDFQDNPLYKNKNDLISDRSVSEIQSLGKSINKVTFNGDQSTARAYDEDIIRLYHIWDRRSRKRMTLSMRVDNPHFEGDWPYDLNGFPYRPLVFEETLPTRDSSSPYPPNVLKPILPQIIEQSMARTQMTKYRKRASAIILTQKGLLTDDDLENLNASEALQVATVSNLSAVQMTQTPALPPDVFAIDNTIKQDLQMGTSMGGMMFAPQPGQRTASQAQIAQSGLQVKSSARVDVVEDFTVDVAQGIAQLSWQFLDKEKVKEITGEEVSESMWPELPKEPAERRRIIQAELQIKIDAGSAAPPKDESVDRKQLLDFLSFIASFAPERLKKDEVIKVGMKRWKFSKDIDKMVLTHDEDERKAAQEENKLLMADVPQVVSPNENHEIHMMEHIKGMNNPTKAGDIHITEHAKWMGIKPKGSAQGEGGGGPQQGDVRMPMNSTNPEMVRQGTPSSSGIMKSVQDRGVGTGAKAV